MKKFILLTLILSTSLVNASFTSPFPSTVEEISIRNTHEVGSSRILRGMNPLGKVEQLIKYGITDILIFKNQTRSEIDEEYQELASKNGNHIKTKQIDFLWHAYPSYKVACESTIDALRYIREVKESRYRKLFYHCTVGEDRTGYLSGLWRMLKDGWSTNRAFYKEMCENGYANGNPDKPDYVVGEIRKDLTPLFLYMAHKIENNELTLGNLSKKICTDRIKKFKLKKCTSSPKYPQ